MPALENQQYYRTAYSFHSNSKSKYAKNISTTYNCKFIHVSKSDAQNSPSGLSGYMKFPPRRTKLVLDTREEIQEDHHTSADCGKQESSVKIFILFGRLCQSLDRGRITQTGTEEME